MWLGETMFHISAALTLNEERIKRERANHNMIRHTNGLQSQIFISKEWCCLLTSFNTWQKASCSFFKVLSSNYFILTCNYLEIMYKRNGSSTWKCNKATIFFPSLITAYQLWKCWLLPLKDFFSFALIFKPAISHLSSWLLPFSWRKLWQNT